MSIPYGVWVVTRFTIKFEMAGGLISNWFWIETPKLEYVKDRFD